MPPTTASSRLSWPTSRLVKSKRFITLALCAPTAPVCLVMGGSSLEHFAAGQQRREDEDDRGLCRHRLLDRAVDYEGELVLARDRMIFDAERIDNRPHGLAHHGLAEIELAKRAALGDEDQRRNLARHHQRGERIRNGAEAAGLHQHGAAQPAHPGAGHDADGFFLARRGENGEKRIIVQRLDQRREHFVRDISDELDVVALEGCKHDLVPGRRSRLHVIHGLGDAIASIIAKAYPNIETGANKKTLPANKGRTMKKSHGNSMLSRRRIIKGAGVLAAGMAAPAFLRIRTAYAAYPERPVKIVVANTPGGPSDIVGRMVAAALQESTGKTFIIENRGGAGSNIGMGYAARSEPDGYTLLLVTNAYSINPTLYNSIPYDPLKDFVGVSELASSPNTFVVRSELPAKTMKEFVALARSTPDKFNVSTPPIGTSPQLQATVLKVIEKLPKLEEVVFKGGGDALQALLSGTVQLSSGSLAPAAPHIKAGTLRCLAVSAQSRWPDLPDVPTMQELGYKDFVFPTDCALMAPAKTPPEYVKWVEAEIHKVLSTPDMKEKLYKAGFLVVPKGADVMWARVNKEITMFRDIINTAGIPKI